MFQGDLEGMRREVTTACEKERQTRVKNKTLASKLKTEEDEARRWEQGGVLDYNYKRVRYLNR